MNVGELIAELEKFPPGKPVRVVLRAIVSPDDDDSYMPLCDADASEADEVRNAGPFVLIRGK